MKWVGKIAFVDESDLVEPLKSVHDWDVDDSTYNICTYFSTETQNQLDQADKIILCIGRDMKVVETYNDDIGKIMPRYGKNFDKNCMKTWEEL